MVAPGSGLRPPVYSPVRAVLDHELGQPPELLLPKIELLVVETEALWAALKDLLSQRDISG